MTFDFPNDFANLISQCTIEIIADNALSPAPGKTATGAVESIPALSPFVSRTRNRRSSSKQSARKSKGSSRDDVAPPVTCRWTSCSSPRVNRAKRKPALIGYFNAGPTNTAITPNDHNRIPCSPRIHDAIDTFSPKRPQRVKSDDDMIEALGELPFANEKNKNDSTPQSQKHSDFSPRKPRRTMDRDVADLLREALSISCCDISKNDKGNGVSRNDSPNSVVTVGQFIG